jgi:hypothetical protein
MWQLLKITENRQENTEYGLSHSSSCAAPLNAATIACKESACTCTALEAVVTYDTQIGLAWKLAQILSILGV